MTSTQTHHPLVTPAEAQALEDVLGYTKAGRWMMSIHAKGQARKRGAKWEDVYCALASAMTCKDQGDGTWMVPSRDAVGDDLTVIVAFQDGVLVVTLF